MNYPSPINSKLPILDMFSNEDEFRDYVAARLDLIEPGLTLLDTEYRITNFDGAGGRIDILARDELDHVVCVEIKRSDHSARATLNELSKYVTLLVARDRVPREMIRCVVVSTDWHELLLPLSYFAYSTGVDVTALHAVRDGEDIFLGPMTLKQLRFLPQLSPDMDLIWFDAKEPRERYIDFIRSRSPRLPFVRLALLLFKPKGILPEGRPPYPMFICVWRVPDEKYDQIETVIGKPIGGGFPYVAPGWEPEADAKNWLDDAPYAEYPEVANGWTHGTSEKLHSVQQNYEIERVERLGDWPKLEFINDDARIVKAALAASPLGGSERANRYSYRATITPAVASSWGTAVDAFLEFIAFEPSWHEAAEKYLGAFAGTDLKVELHAFDKKHLVFAIHQAQAHAETMTGYFEIIVRNGETVIGGLFGEYTWDGKTRPTDPETVINEIYGDVVRARLSMHSAVDNSRYEKANELHGFIPVINLLEEDTMYGGPPPYRKSLQEFVASNGEYSRGLSKVLESIGALPTHPAG
jgi:hypothetical protein|tara:strand:- start:705 stop:2282 length:1578 start_codon:yes stop_codon:yes gene_type:complete